MNKPDALLSTPLEGIRLLDLGRYQAGPRCALMFARMGAEVIKIESLDGDESRSNGPTVRGQSAYWVQYNSGKKSLSVNLRTKEGKDILRDLVGKSDIFLQNFRPGTIEKMGFGYDVLKSLNPKIIMVNVSAYGQYGPYKDRVGFDQIGQAISGLMSMTGFPDDPPIKTYFPLIDRITSLHATIGALAAVREREISGCGQSIEVSLADTGFTVNEIPISAYLGDGIVEEREGNGSGTSNAYPTSDGWIFITAASDAMWPRVCEAIDKSDWLNDPRFSTRESRGEYVSIIESELASFFITKTTKDAVEHLSKYSIPSAPVNTTQQAASDQHVREREIMVEVPDKVAGTIHVTGKMIKFSRTPMTVGQTPTIGEHTQQILSGLLNYSPQKIQQLEQNGIIRT
mgnify:CR=1 FL=1|tara:strand:- start:2637 stop:3836 length:1200 start_codon:yes stop_codon:yes gene_type:complete